MKNYRIVQGDATAPVGEGFKLIPHICNDIGAWGSGFVLAVSKKWSEPEQVYRNALPVYLGDVQYVLVEAEIVVVNMMAQRGIQGPPPLVDYGWLSLCLENVRRHAWKHNATVHMPKIGAGLGGGDWDVIKGIIQARLCVLGIDVTVYEYGG